MRKTMCILLATALTTSMLSETPFLSRSVHSPMSYPTKKLFDSTKTPCLLPVVKRLKDGRTLSLGNTN